MKKKKRIKIIIIAVLVVAVAAGSITGVVYYRNSKGLASVMSVSMISTTNDYTSMTSEGMVCDDACQTINLKDGQKVTEVYVTKDQQVKAGDKLLAYDVTSLSLSVEMKQLEIQSLENQLASEKQKLDKLKNTKPVEKQPESPVTPEPQPDTQPDAPEQKPDEEHDVISDLSEAKGIGTEDDPYVFTCTEASYVSGELLNTLADKSAVARFVIGDANAPDMELIVRGDRLGGYDESDEIKLFLAGTTTAGDASDDTAGSESSDTKTASATEQTAQTEADNAAARKEYRKFKIRCKDTPDDFSMMREVIERRYSKLADRDFPDVILIDGGLGQINSAGEVLERLGKIHLSELLSLAKRDEEIYKYGESVPYSLSKDMEALKIFQRVRDEAHRFGITYHRKLRSKRIISSELDKIDGIGEVRRKKLLTKFGYNSLLLVKYELI